MVITRRLEESDLDPGTRCLCSETLDLNWNGGANLPTGINNPPNSESPFECNTGEGGPISVAGTAATVVNVPATSDLDGPNFFLRRFTGSGNARVLSPSYDFTGKTICMRIYTRYEDIVTAPEAGSGGSVNFKGIEGDYRPNGGVDGQWRKVGGDQGDMDAFHIDKNKEPLWGKRGLKKIADGTTRLADCSDNGWCRVELCLDHDLANTDVCGGSGGAGPFRDTDRCAVSPPPANNINARLRLTALHDCRQDEWADTSLNGWVGDALTGGRFWASRWFINEWFDANIDISYMIGIESEPANEDYWPGSAAEIVNDTCPE